MLCDNGFEVANFESKSKDKNKTLIILIYNLNLVIEYIAINDLEE